MTSLIWSYQARYNFMAFRNKWAMFFRSLVEDIKASQRYVGKKCALRDFALHFYSGISSPLRNSTRCCIRLKHNSLSQCCYVECSIKVCTVLKIHFQMCEQISDRQNVLTFIMKCWKILILTFFFRGFFSSNTFFST